MLQMGESKRTQPNITARVILSAVVSGTIAGCDAGHESDATPQQSVQTPANSTPDSTANATAPDKMRAEFSSPSDETENHTMPEPSPGQLDQKIIAGTDGASFYLYHPKDLEHRMTSPLAWPSYHFACQPEFEAGRLVAFDTGGDGGYGFRITGGPLTKREKKWLASSWEFRYAVRHERVYLDGGYSLPSADYFDESEDHPEQWISLPNGKYKVTVNAIEWYSETGAVDDNGRATDHALPSYVVQFSPVIDFETIEVSRTPPRLETSKDWEAKPSPSFADYNTFEEEDVELAARAPA
jgi:hypothetical protein